MSTYDPQTIQNAIQLWHKLNSDDEVSIKFTKKDGTTRIMVCTLDFRKIPKVDHPKSVDLPKILKLMQNSGILHVYDLEKKAWRSVPFNKLEYLKAGEKIYQIKPIKRLGGK